MTRLFMLALYPFIKNSVALSTAVTIVLHLSRFTAIATAGIVFLVWNFILMPFLAFKFMKTEEQRFKFLSWCFNFKMVNVSCYMKL